jgi:hypothetical protein
MWIIENVHDKYPITLDNRTGGFGSPETASEIQAQGFGWMVGNPYLITLRQSCPSSEPLFGSR